MEHNPTVDITASPYEIHVPKISRRGVNQMRVFWLSHKGEPDPLTKMADCLDSPLRHLVIFACVFLVTFNRSARAQVGREYGNPAKPIVISHVWEKNRRMLKKGNSPRHHLFNSLLCFKGACRKEVGSNKSLGAVSFERFKKRLRQNAKKGLYKNPKTDTSKVRTAKTNIQADT